MNTKETSLLYGVPYREKTRIDVYCFGEADINQYNEEIFNNKVFKNESKPCKVLSSLSLKVFKEMLKNHPSTRVMKGIAKSAENLHQSVFCVLWALLVALLSSRLIFYFLLGRFIFIYLYAIFLVNDTSFSFMVLK